MLYTKNGDNGTSGLFGTKDRRSKDDPVYDALGTVDELNAVLGVCRHACASLESMATVVATLTCIQDRLFLIQAELAGAPKHVTGEHLSELEAEIETLERSIENPRSFVIPGATYASAYADFARTVARRAERSIVHANRTHPVTAEALAYSNRLSSYLYALARYSVHIEHKTEQRPSY